MARYPQVGEAFGPYEVTGVIGQGGMGVVFAARQRGLDRTVALKVLAPHLARQEDYRGRFIREAGALARLDSPHVIHVYDHGEIEGCLYLATQYVAGGDLGRLLGSHGALPTRAALTIAAQVAEALDDAHRVGIVHRDVKPSNILLRAGGSEPFSYLCDFGIAQEERADVTATGAVAGTVAYLAPERCRGEDATPATDVYALGCVLVAAMTGHAPYRGSDVEVGVQHLQAPVPQLPGSDHGTAALNQVLRRALAKDPADRHPSAAALRDDLRHTLDVTAQRDASLRVPARPVPGPPGSPGPGTGTGGWAAGTGPGTSTGLPPGGGRPPARRSRALPWVAAGLVGVVLIAATAVGALVMTRDDTTDESSGDGSSASTEPTESGESEEAGESEGAGESEDPTSAATPDEPAGGSASGTTFPAAATATPASGEVVTTDAFTYRALEGWEPYDHRSSSITSAMVATVPTRGFSHNINTVEEPVPASTTLNQVGIGMMTSLQQLGAEDIEAHGIYALDGVDAVYQSATLLAAGDVPYRVHQFVALKDGMAHTLTFSQSVDTPEDEAAAEIGSILATFAWR